jgi:hypothetical protein
MNDKLLPRNRNPNNPVLVKHEVGKSKNATYNLPPITHTYGKAPKKDAEGAKEGYQYLITISIIINYSDYDLEVCKFIKRLRSSKRFCWN